MKQKITLSKKDKTIRTQITLTKELKELIEQRAQLKNQSLSEYLRRGAWISLLLEEDEAEELEQLANQVVGSVDLDKHPEWQTSAGIKNWVKGIREEWR